MTHFQCHYESLKVTRDAPPEVIRAAYRSLSQKHHPDKNNGNPEADHVMARLNLAYKVLSDAVQRELYDLQLQHARVEPHAFTAGADDAATDPAPRQASTGRGAALFHWLRRRMPAWRGRAVAVGSGLLALLLAAGGWFIWNEQRTMLLLEHAATAARGTVDVPDPGFIVTPAADVRDTPSVPLAADTPTAKPAPAPAPKAAEATPPADKRSDYERLTALLKSMGLGLHKLDAPPPATPRPAAPPPEPAKAVRETRTAAAPAPAPVAAPRAAASAPAPASEPARARDEAPVAAEPARVEAKATADAGRAAAAPASNAAASANADSAAARQPMIVDARACAPTYPMRAYANGEAGTVQLELLVAGDGNVVDSKIRKSSGSRELDKAARKALSQCKFTASAARHDPVWTMLEYRFSLD